MNKLSIADQFIALTSGETIAYYDSNPLASAEEPCIVLLHGYCGSSAYFSRIISLLKEHYRVLAPDLIGHGNSDASELETYNMEAAAGWVIDWLDKLNVQQAHLFGHSLGGYITLAVAASPKYELASFGLLHSTALPDHEQAKLNRDAAIKAVQQNGVESFVAGLVVKLFADAEESRSDVDYAAQIGNVAAPQAVIGFARGMKLREDRSEVVHQATAPVLLIAGARDNIVSPESTFTGKNDKTECHIIEQAGHMGMLETPQELAELVLSFLNRQYK